MDHRCLYGHRVPAAFTYAIQSRSCPTCGAPTVTLTGYQAARKLATDAGLDAVAAFNVVRILESEWTLSPAIAAPAAVETATPALSVEPPHVTDEEVVVVEDVPDVPAPTAVAEPRITARVKSERRNERVEPRAEGGPAVAAPAAEAASGRAGGFGDDEEDFFKQA